jgi:hypothetical protein
METRNESNNETVADTSMGIYFEFLVPGVMLNIVGILGLIGNLISIFILSRPQMKGSTNCILIGLATYDSILILTRYTMLFFSYIGCPTNFMLYQRGHKTP